MGGETHSPEDILKAAEEAQRKLEAAQEEEVQSTLKKRESLIETERQAAAKQKEVGAAHHKAKASIKAVKDRGGKVAPEMEEAESQLGALHEQTVAATEGAFKEIGDIEARPDVMDRIRDEADAENKKHDDKKAAKKEQQKKEAEAEKQIAAAIETAKAEEQKVHTIEQELARLIVEDNGWFLGKNRKKSGYEIESEQSYNENQNMRKKLREIEARLKEVNATFLKRGKKELVAKQTEETEQIKMNEAAAEEINKRYGKAKKSFDQLKERLVQAVSTWEQIMSAYRQILRKNHKETDALAEAQAQMKERYRKNNFDYFRSGSQTYTDQFQRDVKGILDEVKENGYLYTREDKFPYVTVSNGQSYGSVPDTFQVSLDKFAEKFKL